MRAVGAYEWKSGRWRFVSLKGGLFSLGSLHLFEGPDEGSACPEADSVDVVAAAVPRRDVAVRTMRVPVAREDLAMKAAVLEAADKLPFPVEEAAVVARPGAGGEIMLFAARASEVDECARKALERVTGGGPEESGVEVVVGMDAAAVLDALHWHGLICRGRSVVVSVFEHYTSVDRIDDGVLVDSRLLMSGGLKLESSPASQDRFLASLRRMLDLMAPEREGEARIICSGSWGGVDGVRRTLERLGPETSFFFLPGMSLEKSCEYVVPYGLALAALGRSRYEVLFRDEPPLPWYGSPIHLGACALAMAALLVGYSFFCSALAGRLENRIAGLRSACGERMREVARGLGMKPASPDPAALRKFLSAAGKLLKGGGHEASVRPVLVLSALSEAAAHSGVELTDVSVGEKGVRLVIRASSFERADSFKSSLERSGVFDGMRYSGEVRGRSGTGTGLTFTITGRLAATAQEGES